jgi:hypothetical protein
LRPPPAHSPLAPRENEERCANVGEPCAVSQKCERLTRSQSKMLAQRDDQPRRAGSTATPSFSAHLSRQRCVSFAEPQLETPAAGACGTNSGRCRCVPPPVPLLCAVANQAPTKHLPATNQPPTSDQPTNVHTSSPIQHHTRRTLMSHPGPGARLFLYDGVAIGFRHLGEFRLHRLELIR